MNRVLLKCTIASALGGLLFGYDTVIINGAMLDLVKHFHLTPAIQGWTVSSALVGCILGTILIGKPGDIIWSATPASVTGYNVSDLINRLWSGSHNNRFHPFPIYRWSCDWWGICSMPGIYL